MKTRLSNAIEIDPISIEQAAVFGLAVFTQARCHIVLQKNVAWRRKFLAAITRIEAEQLVLNLIALTQEVVQILCALWTALRCTIRSLAFLSRVTGECSPVTSKNSFIWQLDSPVFVQSEAAIHLRQRFVLHG